MEFGTPEPLEPEIEVIEDTAYPIQFNEDGKTYYFMERWDTLHHFEKIGAWALKIFDDVDGLVEGWTDDESAQKIIEATGTKPKRRDSITKGEHKAWKRSQGIEDDE